jgi:hypothetical protein
MTTIIALAKFDIVQLESTTLSKPASVAVG